MSFKRCWTSGEHKKNPKCIKPPPRNAFFRRFQKHAQITYSWLRTISNETLTLLPGSGAFGIPNMFLSHAHSWADVSVVRNAKNTPGPAEDVSHARGSYRAAGIYLYIIIGIYQLYEDGTFCKPIFCHLHRFSVGVNGFFDRRCPKFHHQDQCTYIKVCVWIRLDFLK